MTPAPRLQSASGDPGPLKLAAAIDQPEASKPKRILPAGMEPMLGIDDLAAILRWSRRLVERMRSAGRVPMPDFHAGRCARWRAETIRRWIEAGGRQ